MKYMKSAFVVVAIVCSGAVHAAATDDPRKSAGAPVPDSGQDEGFQKAIKACAVEQGLASMPRPGDEPKPGEKQPDMEKFGACLTAKGYPPPEENGKAGRQ
ncbi:MAG: hypothetical protein QM761_10650 [Pseudoxanthomonas sp.]